MVFGRRSVPSDSYEYVCLPQFVSLCVRAVLVSRFLFLFCCCFWCFVWVFLSVCVHSSEGLRLFVEVVSNVQVQPRYVFCNEMMAPLNVAD